MGKKPVRKIVAFHMLVVGALGAALLLFVFIGSCPIRALTHVPCPTCGMYRSFFALLRGDFRQSFLYHPLTVPFCLVLWFAIHRKLFRMSKRAKDAILIAAAVTVFAVYFFRLLTGRIP